MKNQKGITLIALVITIIVMLILVGVSVAVSLKGGLFKTAKQATSQTQILLDKEQLLQAVMEKMGNDGKVNFENLNADLPEGFTKIAEKTYKSKAGNIFNVSDYGEITEDSSEGETATYTAYSIGDEVTVGGENFYVIKESHDLNPMVTLLAKYCLNSEGVQENIAYSNLGDSFSSTNYWSDETEYPLDLNDYPIPEGVTSIITTAKAYGESKGGTGRLMTYEEASQLVTNYEGIICGTTTGAASGYYYYWLGSAMGDDKVGRVHGQSCEIDSWIYYMGMPCAVRPVIEISKDLVSKVS